MDESWVKLHWADGRQRVWWCMGEQFAHVSVVNRVLHGVIGVYVWALMSYRQQTLVQRYHDGIHCCAIRLFHVEA